MDAGLYKINQVASDVLVEFLEVAFNCILYMRTLYPPGVFERRKKYNVPVQMCCHHDVNNYIKSLLQSIKKLFEDNEAEVVVFMIFSPDGKPREKFTFELGAIDTRALGSDKYLLKLEQLLRSLLLKLNISDASLSDLPEGCTWAIQIHTKESAVLDMQQKQQTEDFTWIVADETETNIGQNNIIPVKSVHSDILKMQVYIQESTE